MSSEDTIFSDLTKITQIRDYLVAISEKVEDDELVNVVLRGIPRS
jgi:hypothetical protein